MLDRPAIKRAKGWSSHRFSGAEIETGMMPGTADRGADHDAFGERPVIVGAVGAHSEDVRAPPDQQDLLGADMAGQHATLPELGKVDALREVRAGGGGFILSHC